MRLAVLGGSFNPIHIGHLHLAEMALFFGYDKVLLIPANISPFKQSAAAAASSDRLDMILASIAGDPRVIVDDLELRRGGVSYTIDTVKAIIERYKPEGKPALVLGDDLAADFSKWKDAEELARISDIIIARRLSGEGGQVFPFSHKALNNEVMDISSAMIRERIALSGGTGSGGNSGAGRAAWRYLVPRGARLIIEDRGLYRAGESAADVPERGATGEITGELIARVEDAARAAISAGRFIHSRNTAIMARGIAARFGLDVRAAWLAGIAHDMAKEQSSDLEHGKAAAVLLETRFGIHNKDVLEAVAVHTMGRPGMGALARALFIADKIEFSRGVEQRRFREMFGKIRDNADASVLDELFYAVLENNINWLRAKGKKVAEESIRLLEER